MRITRGGASMRGMGLLLLIIALLTPRAWGQSLEEEARRLSNQAEQLYQQGRYIEAIPLIKRILAIARKVRGEEHLDVADSLNNLALLYQALGDYAQAEPLYKRALAIRERKWVVQSPLRPTCLPLICRHTGGPYILKMCSHTALSSRTPQKC